MYSIFDVIYVLTAPFLPGGLGLENVFGAVSITGYNSSKMYSLVSSAGSFVSSYIKMIQLVIALAKKKLLNIIYLFGDRDIGFTFTKCNHGTPT